MKTKFIILLSIFTLLILTNTALANVLEIQNIVWLEDYTIKFDEIKGATKYKYNFSVNSNKKPNTLFDVTNFEYTNGSIHFFPEEALEYFHNTPTSVYTVWIIALDQNNNELTSLTQSSGGKIILFNQLSALNNKPILKNETNSNKVDEENKLLVPPKEESIEFDKENTISDNNLINNNWNNPFEDVYENTWYYNSIKFSNQNNLLNGVSTNKFEPKAPMTRGMLAYVLYTHSQDKTKISPSFLFSDVKETTYYYEAISWMRENNISAGMGKNTFKPNDPLTREQLITILYNYSIYLGKNVKSVIIDFSSFNDANDIHAWAKNPLCWALNNKLIAGRTENSLAPREATTRAEFATILMRFLNI